MRQAVHPPLPQEAAMAEVEAMEHIASEQTQAEMPEIPGALRAHYIAPEDANAWVPAWKLEQDWKGREVGRPIRLPIGQLSGPSGLLRARRPDGKPAFTLVAPKYVQGEPNIPCFVGTCRKKLLRRVDLVAHVRQFHSQEAQVYKTALEQIEQKAAYEDERLKTVLASLENIVEETEPIDLSGPVAEVESAPVKGKPTSPEGNTFYSYDKPKEIDAAVEPGQVNLAVQKKECPWPGCDWHYEGMAMHRPIHLGKHVADVHGG